MAKIELTVHWIAETQNPANMVYAGWGKASFKPGDEVTVALMPTRNGLPYGRILQVVLPSGKTLIAIGAKADTGSPSGSKPAAPPKP